MTTRSVRLMLAGAAIALGATTGCQTWTSGMTLPSGRYLEHPPQYFPPSPAFPLSRELATQERLQAGVNGAALPPLGPDAAGPGGVVPLPPPP
ncbi:MAG: hypothetical protein ACRC33_06415 [Gemmataceae bacterium]